jgi:Cu2+-exporting ATPase
MRSLLGSSRALENLAALLPSHAHRLMNGQTQDVPVASLKVGNRVLVKPGEKVPADGRILEGRTEINESLLTGESRPAEKAEGNEVIGGSINGEGGFTMEVRKAGKQTYVAQVVELVRAAQESRSRMQDLAGRAAVALTVIAVSVSAITLAAWLTQGASFAFSLQRAVTVMVITCPHALGLAAPLVIAVSTSLSARHGLLIRNRAAFERARKVQAVLFDKTGTLTEGRFAVAEVISLDGVDAREILRLAAGIVEEARHRGIVPAATQEFRAFPGRGARAIIEGRSVRVVSEGYLRENGMTVEDARLAGALEQGRTLVYVLTNGDVLGALALEDVIRPQSYAAIRHLRQMGIQAMMLTGDSSAAAARVAGELKLDDYFADVLPGEKAQKVKEVQARGLVVAMAGDGVNDAPALATADVGMAIGAGADVAIEAADVVLVRSDPLDVTAAIDLARATYRKMVENLLWATGYNVVAIPLAAGVLYTAGITLSPAAGAALMAVSMTVVAINARLLRIRRR